VWSYDEYVGKEQMRGAQEEEGFQQRSCTIAGS
jgi:hypothetical protein